MKEHVNQCNSVAHLFVFNSFWTTVELDGTEEEDISGFGYTENTDFFDNKKYSNYQQNYRLSNKLNLCWYLPDVYKNVTGVPENKMCKYVFFLSQAIHWFKE